MPEVKSIESAFHEPGSSHSLPYQRDGVVAVSEAILSGIVMMSARSAVDELPAVNTVISRQSSQIYGLAPDRWLVVSLDDEENPGDFTSSGLFATDVSDAWAALKISGERAEDILQSLCAVDLHPSSFPAGSCFRSRLGANPALISRPMAGEPLNSFDVFIPRSSARSCLEDILDVAARI